MDGIKIFFYYKLFTELLYPIKVVKNTNLGKIIQQT